MAPPDHCIQIEEIWTTIDAEFSAIIAPVHLRLATDDLQPSEAATVFTSLLRDHLESHDQLPRMRLDTGQEKRVSMVHRTRKIKRIVVHLKDTKNNLRKHRKKNPKAFFDACRLYNKCLNGKKMLDHDHDVRRQEKAFRTNPWHFSKKVCNGKTNQEQPEFDANQALAHFQTAFAGDCHYTHLPHWVEEVMPAPLVEEVTPFDMSAITPGCIKRLLKKRPSNSSPGKDRISYHHLKKMPSTHHFLATLFSKILLKNPKAPKEWCSAKITLIQKGGDKSTPENFRPIALTSAIGKLFNKLIATRLEHYLRRNGLLDTSLQKGFVTDTNGTIEYIFAMSAIIQNARAHNSPLAVTFLDLKNAFGSVSHSLIRDMLAHIRLPPEICSYINSTYSQLTAYVETKDWSTPCFPISKGVFQGDTLSPLIFLIAFNPVLAAAHSLSTLGFRVTVPAMRPPELPPENSYIYALWDEEDSAEASGWYLAKVTSILPDGSASLYYRKTRASETINLNDIQWFSSRGNGKWFLHPEKGVPNQLSAPHKVKGFADDSTVISSSTEDHQRALHALAHFCTDLALTLKPPKCVSFVYDGRQVDKRTTFYLGDGKTRNIASGPTRFLGQTLCHTPLSTAQEAGKRLSSEFSRQLNNLDQSPIRGEFKLWIYRRFMVSCFHYHLAVDTIPTSTLKKMQANAVRKIKKWLGLTRGATTAIIHHPDVIDIPAISELHTKAKLTFLSAISVSQDPMITELEALLSDDSLP